MKRLKIDKKNSLQEDVKKRPNHYKALSSRDKERIKQGKVKTSQERITELEEEVLNNQL